MTWLFILAILFFGDFIEFLVAAMVVWVASGILGVPFSWDFAVLFYLLMCIVRWIHGKE